MEEDIEELLKRKDDYDFAYGTQIHRPYAMSEKDWELIENLLTRYKQLEERVIYLTSLLCINDSDEDFIPKSKIKDQIKIYQMSIDNLKNDNSIGSEGASKNIRKKIEALQELLEEE